MGDDRQFIGRLDANQLVSGVFSIQNCQLGLTRSGKPFLKCLIGDRTGRVAGRMWNTSEATVKSLPTEGFVRIEGQTQPYQGELQIILRQVDVIEPTREQLEELLPSTDRDVEEMFGELRSLLTTVGHTSIRRLLELYLDDEALMADFKHAPAAVQLHHAYLGGLLEHTLGLLRTAEALLPLYPDLNRDLVLVGLFLHDLAKCRELTWQRGFAYTDEGRLVGHVARGVIWLDRKAEECGMLGHPLPNAALHVLHHIILSHHGQPEHGALVPPSTPEAIFVSHLDDLDAKLQMALRAARSEPDASERLGGNFTSRMWALDNVRLYRPDPLSDDNQP